MTAVDPANTICAGFKAGFSARKAEASSKALLPLKMSQSNLVNAMANFTRPQKRALLIKA
jgi:hypothetical protein